MTKLYFPDVNVWFALAVADHPHHASARAWWKGSAPSRVGFCRATQMGLLRILTTASAMGGSPLTNESAWRVYDGFAEDARVVGLVELPPIDELFRRFSRRRLASPKIWADCYLAAHASANHATLVTFDRAFRGKDVERLLLE